MNEHRSSKGRGVAVGVGFIVCLLVGFLVGTQVNLRQVRLWRSAPESAIVGRWVNKRGGVIHLRPNGSMSFRLDATAPRYHGWQYTVEAGKIWVYSSPRKAEIGQGYSWEFTISGDRLAIVDHFHEGEKVYARAQEGTVTR